MAAPYVHTSAQRYLIGGREWVDVFDPCGSAASPSKGMREFFQGLLGPPNSVNHTASLACFVLNLNTG